MTQIPMSPQRPECFKLFLNHSRASSFIPHIFASNSGTRFFQRIGFIVSLAPRFLSPRLLSDLKSRGAASIALPRIYTRIYVDETLIALDLRPREKFKKNGPGAHEGLALKGWPTGARPIRARPIRARPTRARPIRAQGGQ